MKPTITLFIVLLVLSASSCKKGYRCRVCNNGFVAMDQFVADPCHDGSNRYENRYVEDGYDPYKDNSYCTEL